MAWERYCLRSRRNRNRSETRYYRLDVKSVSSQSLARELRFDDAKWGDYRHWLDSLVTFTEGELIEVRERAKQFVLDEMEQVVFDPSLVRVDPPIFKLLLEISTSGPAPKESRLVLSSKRWSSVSSVPTHPISKSRREQKASETSTHGKATA